MIMTGVLTIKGKKCKERNPERLSNLHKKIFYGEEHAFPVLTGAGGIFLGDLGEDGIGQDTEGGQGEGRADHQGIDLNMGGSRKFSQIINADEQQAEQGE